MTEKEFEQLKEGDKVWIIPWFKGESVFQGTISKIGRYNENTSNKWVSVEESKAYTYPSEYVFKTKVEAFEALVRKRETSVIADRCMLHANERELVEAKAELAKAKEEERRKEWWYVSYKEQTVAKLPLVMDSDAEAEIFETEQEAYEALARFHERKLFKTLEKCGYKFAICCDKNIAVVKIDTDNGEFFWGHYYPHLSYGSIRKTNVFDTLEEAEAELERRKK